MKKNILFLIPLILFGFAYMALAQEGVTECGTLELEGDSLEGNESVALTDELICLGEQLLGEDSSAKVYFSTESYGEMEFYIEKGEDSNFVAKVSFGDAAGMAEENQSYANTFYACPANIDDISEASPDLDFEERPGALALWAYLTVSEMSSDPVTNDCVGTYFTIEEETEQEEEIVEEETEEEVAEIEIIDFSIDRRKLFSEIMTSDRLSEIEESTNLELSNNVDGCQDELSEGTNECIYYFNGDDKDQFNNPVVNLSVNLLKQNQKVNDTFSLYQSIMEAVNSFSALKNTYTNLGYLDNSADIELEGVNSDSFRLFESEDKRLVILKNSWVIEIDFTSGVGNEYVSSLANEIISEIDDLLEIDMSALQSFDISLQEEEETEEFEENDGQDTQEENSLEENQIQEETEEIDNSLLGRLRGKIILKVEENGEAYYVDPSDDSINYLGRPEDAFAVMRDKGIGITTSNLKVIPIGVIALTGPDDDGDGLSNIFEDAMSTNKNNVDTDGDSYSDKAEIEGGYSPYGAGNMVYDYNFTKKQLGKIFLQVENNGEAWYVNPGDSKRYFLGRPADAFNIMRTLGLGISNNDFASLGIVAN